MADAEPVDILVVDDEPGGRMALQAVLEPLGQNLVMAQSGREALRQVLEHDFAAILLDVQMPVMDGFETATLIREREKSRATPILFITAALRTESSMFQGYLAGAVDYLFKPVVPEILRGKLRVFIELYRQRHELERLNRALEENALRLSAANRELEAFSYSASHDLRAPLRHMQGLAHALDEEFGSLIPPTGRDYLARIEAAGARLTRLIEDLLGLAKMSRKDLNRERFDAAPMVEEIAAALRRDAPARKVEFVIPPSLPIEGDPGLVRVVYDNLVGNAWKYSATCPQATIEIGVREPAGGPRVYYVRDDGTGFDLVTAGDKLFAPFRRFHSGSEYAGTGIGLATVQRIIHRHGGRIWAESAPGKGATFSFTLTHGSQQEDQA